MTTTATADLEVMRASALLDSDPAAAAQCAGDILARAPDHTEAQLLLATACRRLGDPARAVVVLESLTKARPEAAVLQLELGRALRAGGRAADATAALSRAVALDAALSDGWRELAKQLFEVGDTAGGDRAYANYERRALDPPGLRDAVEALAEERLDTAEFLLAQRLQNAPEEVVTLRLLAQVAIRRERLEDAERLLEACLRLAPGYALARYDLANVYYSRQRAEKVLPLLDRLLAVEPRHALCLDLKARTLRLVGRWDEAIALLDEAVLDRPTDSAAWVLRGHVLREIGRPAEAIDAYRRAISLRPDASEAYWSLANMKTVRFSDAELGAMRELLARTSLQRENRVQFEFALGKALEDRGAYAESFARYQQGNVLHRSTIRHDPAVTSGLVRRSKLLYTPEFFAARSGWGSERRDPIFILGVPRSGSTLIEQMLATHSQVEGTRELSDLSIVSIDLISGSEPLARQNYPDAVAALDRQSIESAAAQYLARTEAHRVLGKPRFIDKMPANFSHVGLIHLLFPNCAIIDARRNPMACAFSCYKQLFVWGAAFSYDFAELARHIRDYTELMAHFDTVLPGRVHRVYYEELVADPEAELRSLLGYCGLPFERECLKFYENRRVVQTISSEQVRQPLYAESLDQWRNYAPWLGPLEEALADLLESYPVVADSTGAPAPATEQ